MGPRHFSRGNSWESCYSYLWAVCFNGAATLQSRKPERTDSRQPNGAASMGPRHFSRGNKRRVEQTEAQRVASMGPRHFSRGNVVGGRGGQAGQRASMGPRHFSRGNALCLAQGERPHGASMGPRHFSRGNMCTICGSPSHDALQWGLDTSVAETGYGDTIASALVGVLQWGLDTSVAETAAALSSSVASKTSFNGAATLQSRKRTRLTPTSRAYPRFNGAATLQSRKQRPLRSGASWLRSLQWGRDTSVAETITSYSNAGK